MDAQIRHSAASEITQAEAANALPRKSNGRKVHVRTVQRWIEKGCRGVFLEGRRAGNVWYTTLEAIERFRSAGTASRIASQPVAIPTVTQQRRNQREAAAKLKAKGVKVDVQDKDAARRALEKAQVHAVPLTT
jgi:hypothetical protein